LSPAFATFTVECAPCVFSFFSPGPWPIHRFTVFHILSIPTFCDQPRPHASRMCAWNLHNDTLRTLPCFVHLPSLLSLFEEHDHHASIELPSFNLQSNRNSLRQPPSTVNHFRASTIPSFSDFPSVMFPSYLLPTSAPMPLPLSFTFCLLSPSLLRISH